MARNKKISRKIYFYRVGNLKEVLPLLPNAFSQIDALPFDAQGRYLQTIDSETALALYVQSSDFPIKAQYARIRRDNLPLIEESGSVEGLKLSEAAGIMDWSHFIIYSDGYVVAEFNHNAPRISRLGEYLTLKARGCLPDAPDFLPLYRRDVIAAINKMDTVTTLEVEAPTNSAEAIREADDDLAAAFSAASHKGQVESARIILKKADDGWLIATAKKLLSTTSAREALSSLRVTGREDGSSRSHNLFEQYLIGQEEIVLLNERTRAVDSTDAFAALARAYDKHRDLLGDAAVAKDLR